nr:aldehyde dehydrogenase family protein [Rhizobiaceae bacterium]
MASHPDVDMVTFTGSTGVGKAIAASACATLKKVALELGGKNPQVIFPDADLESAADAVAFGVYFNQGECCNSGSRIIVHEDIAEAFLKRVEEISAKVPFGDPLDPATQVGATIRIGGSGLVVPGLTGQFFQPTIVSGVTADMVIAREEVFGPVLSVMTFRTLDEAIALANDAAYGLSAGVWSENVHTCLAFARRVQAGTIWTNTWMDGFPEMPFGGFKQSGSGRELGRYGLDEFLEVKTLTMRIGRTRAPWVKQT